MIHSKTNLQLPFPMNHPVIENAVKKDALIFDIETTGLNPHYNQVILIGFIQFDRLRRPVLHQLFLEDAKEEPELLTAFREIVEGSGFYITYNGNSFDLPFLNTRMRKHGQTRLIDSFYNIDLMRILKTSRFNLPVKDYKLKTIEKFMGISREDQISGKESAALYEEYLSGKDPSVKSKILLHNSEDIINLYRLMKILELAEAPELFFDFNHELEIEAKKFRVQSYRMRGSFIVVTGNCIGEIREDWFINDGLFSFELRADSGTFIFSIPTLKEGANGNMVSFIDWQAIPFASKTLESFINRDPRRLLLVSDGVFESETLLALLRILLEEIFKQ